MRRILVLALFVVTLPGWAAVTYTAVTRTILGAKTSNGDFRVQGWISGNRARIAFLESQLPELGSGNYLISSDGGETVYLVNPRDMTYERWDITAMVSGMADMMRNLRGEMNVRFEEPTVEKLLEEPGPLMRGMPTRHYRYRTSYKAYIDMYEKETILTVLEEDIWTTTAISEPGIKVFLNRRASSGDEQLDRILEKEMSKVPGFPLKRITSTRTETKKQTTETRSEMEVVELKTVAVPDSLFKVPKGYVRMDADDPEMTRAMKKLERNNKTKEK